MKQVSIKNKISQTITNQAQFETQAEIDAWVEECEKVEAFGKPQHQIEILDENNQSFEPQQFETIPAEYTIEIEDVTAQVDQERINAEAQAFLDESDYRVLRHYGQVSLGIELSLTEEEFLVLENERQEARERIIR